MTPEYNWHSDEPNTFKTRNLIVKSFYTPMPSVCDYSKLIKYLTERQICDSAFYKKINQDHNDIKFINMFYDTLMNLFDRVNSYGGYVTCFSFAVFNATTEKSTIKNYHMFKEIQQLFKQNPNRILAEWIYDMAYYNMNIYNMKDCICFISSESLKKDVCEKLYRLSMAQSEIIILS